MLFFIGKQLVIAVVLLLRSERIIREILKRYIRNNMVGNSVAG